MEGGVAVIVQKQGDVFYILDEIYVKRITSNQFGWILATTTGNKPYSPEIESSYQMTLPKHATLPRSLGGLDHLWGDRSAQRKDST